MTRRRTVVFLAIGSAAIAVVCLGVCWKRMVGNWYAFRLKEAVVADSGVQPITEKLTELGSDVVPILLNWVEDRELSGWNGQMYTAAVKDVVFQIGESALPAVLDRIDGVESRTEEIARFVFLIYRPEGVEGEMWGLGAGLTEILPVIVRNDNDEEIREAAQRACERMGIQVVDKDADLRR